MNYIENCKKAPTFLEKGDQKRKFTSQSEVDQAWAEGWYAPGRPESAKDKPTPRPKSIKTQKKDKK